MTITTKKSDQKGTLLIEAIAMLGLIAMVTPTLYKKSAERLQEIQDINVATQARMMGSTIDTFVRSHLASLKEVAGTADGNVVKLCLNDNTSGCFSFGYSSDIPAGFRPGELKGYRDPEIYVRNDEGKLVYYILYPKHNDINQRRAARLASLVGANGGFVKDKKFVQGVGGAWELDSAMIDEMKFNESALTENSLVVTAPEPIVATINDSDKYLYRVPAGDNSAAFHNTMVTNLFLGGHNESSGSDYQDQAEDFYSIFNVRKLTLNTNCKYGETKSSDATPCLPEDVADLYIGKPFDKFNEADGKDGARRPFKSNRGAAWIYGNLSAVSDRFKVFHTDYQNVDKNLDQGGDSGISHRGGYDVLRFARTDSSDGTVWDESSKTVEFEVLHASNQEGSAEVAMIDGYVRAVENYKDQGGDVGRAFLVGGSSDTNDSSLLIEAFENKININKIADGTTRINPNGGYVYINGDSSGTGASAVAHTYINPAGGELHAGKEGNWMKAWDDGSTVVHILNGSGSAAASANRKFVVGNDEGSSHMILANEDKVSLRGGQIRAYSSIAGNAAISSSAFSSDTVGIASGTTVIASRITDILGGTYMGNNAISSSGDGVYYGRNDGGAGTNHWTLGVAGSAWVDDLLYARRAWMSNAGFKDLHAGFSSFAEYSSTPEKGWFNVYGGAGGSVVVRDPNKAHGNSSNISNSTNADTMFYADSAYTYIGDTIGAYAAFQDGNAYIGTRPFNDVINTRNYFAADSSDARVVGSTLAQIYTANTGSDDFVDIQKGAMLFNGYSWTGDDRSTHTYDNNTIEAHAGKYMLHTKNISSTSGESAAVFYADADNIRTRYVDFSVENDSSVARFKVMPNEDPSSTSGSANVMVNGSFHVTGNEVIHIASNSSNAAGVDDDNPHAVFEVDPTFVKVMARDSAGNFIDAVGSSGATDGKLAILKINPDDTMGGSSIADNTRDASVYIRRGAIELEESPNGSSAADEGFGYIKANRFVAHTDLRAPVAPGGDSDGHYDQFMVNPAYTSVMHDIKLTTRGGARLSDILPDYILKGVYNVSNDYFEGNKNHRAISSSDDPRWCGTGGNTCTDTTTWANSYVGIIPYAVCPRGYKNMATIVPISFQMGQAGEIIKADALYGKPAKSINYAVNPASRQMHILSVASNDPDKDIIYPGLHEVTSYTYGGVSSEVSDNWPPNTFTRTAGWFMGFDAVYDNTGSTASNLSHSSIVTKNGASAFYYEQGAKEGSSQVGYAGEPLYFQQNTYLKTSLAPGEYGGISGWEGRMGFLYNPDLWVGDRPSFDNTGIRSNYNASGENESSTSEMTGYVWNLFPVPTRSLEGHATVYCYFDRKEFLGGENLDGGIWKGLIDPIDQLNKDKFRPITKASGGKSDKDSSYTERLHDPSLKYNDPW